MMKKFWIVVHFGCIAYWIVLAIIDIDWNWFLYTISPFSFGGVVIFTVAFVSGGNQKFLEKFRLAI